MIHLVKKWAPKANFGKSHRSRHVAIVERGGAIVAIAHNFDHTHAEVRALKKLWPDHRTGTRVWSFRLLRNGQLGLAKPCPKCEAYMKKCGVKDVFYSTNDGDIKRIKL